LEAPMRRFFWLMLMALGVLLTAKWPVQHWSTIWAAENKASKSISSEVLDDWGYAALSRAHREAATSYNDGYPTRAVYLFRGALLAAQQFLDHQPVLKQIIAKGLRDDAESRASMDRRAWALYDIVARVEEILEPKMPLALAESSTLWDRLGGER